MTTINTDLLTPLGAYLRLRAMGRASFLLESVERGRLGRYSWMGAGSRLVGFEEAEALDLPVVGYLAYDFAAQLEPTVPLPGAGRDLPESRLVVAETLVRFDHGAGTADVVAGDTDEIAGRLDGGIPWHRETRGVAGELRRFPEREAYEEMVRRCKEHIVAGDAFQIVPSQRAERPTSASPLDVYRALRRVNPSPYLFLLELDGIALVGSSPERLVASRTARRASPDRRDDRADRGRRRAAALVREGPGGAHDAGRSRPQRPLARVPGGHRPRRARSWRWSASPTSRTSCRRSSAGCEKT